MSKQLPIPHKLNMLELLVLEQLHYKYFLGHTFMVLEAIHGCVPGHLLQYSAVVELLPCKLVDECSNPSWNDPLSGGQASADGTSKIGKRCPKPGITQSWACAIFCYKDLRQKCKSTLKLLA